MAVEWGLAGPGFNALQVLQSAGIAQQQRAQQQQLQMQQAELARKEQQRQAIAGAFDPNTGREDPAALRRAYLQNGDVDGLREYNKSLKGDEAEGAKLLGQFGLYADTPEKWDSGIDALVAQGADPSIARLKGQFSEQNRMSVLAAGGQYDNYLTNSKPSYQVVPEGGMLVNTRDPNAVRSIANGQNPSAGGGLEAAAAAAIAAGADPAAVQARMRQMQGGGAPSQGGATFP